MARDLFLRFFCVLCKFKEVFLGNYFVISAKVKVNSYGCVFKVRKFLSETNGG